MANNDDDIFYGPFSNTYLGPPKPTRWNTPRRHERIDDLLQGDFYYGIFSNTPMGSSFDNDTIALRQRQVLSSMPEREVANSLRNHFDNEFGEGTTVIGRDEAGRYELTNPHWNRGEPFVVGDDIAADIIGGTAMLTRYSIAGLVGGNPLTVGLAEAGAESVGQLAQLLAGGEFNFEDVALAGTTGAGATKLLNWLDDIRRYSGFPDSSDPVGIIPDVPRPHDPNVGSNAVRFRSGMNSQEWPTRDLSQEIFRILFYGMDTPGYATSNEADRFIWLANMFEDNRDGLLKHLREEGSPPEIFDGLAENIGYPPMSAAERNSYLGLDSPGQEVTPISPLNDNDFWAGDPEFGMNKHEAALDAQERLDDLGRIPPANEPRSGHLGMRRLGYEGDNTFLRNQSEAWDRQTKEFASLEQQVAESTPDVQDEARSLVEEFYQEQSPEIRQEIIEELNDVLGSTRMSAGTGAGGGGLSSGIVISNPRVNELVEAVRETLSSYPDAYFRPETEAALRELIQNPGSVNPESLSRVRLLIMQDIQNSGAKNPTSGIQGGRGGSPNWSDWATHGDDEILSDESIRRIEREAQRGRTGREEARLPRWRWLTSENFNTRLGLEDPGAPEQVPSNFTNFPSITDAAIPEWTPETSNPITRDLMPQNATPEQRTEIWNNLSGAQRTRAKNWAADFLREHGVISGDQRITNPAVTDEWRVRAGLPPRGNVGGRPPSLEPSQRTLSRDEEYIAHRTAAAEELYGRSSLAGSFTREQQEAINRRVEQYYPDGVEHRPWGGRTAAEDGFTAEAQRRARAVARAQELFDKDNLSLLNKSEWQTLQNEGLLPPKGTWYAEGTISPTQQRTEAAENLRQRRIEAFGLDAADGRSIAARNAGPPPPLATIRARYLTETVADGIRSGFVTRDRYPQTFRAYDRISAALQDSNGEFVEEHLFRDLAEAIRTERPPATYQAFEALRERDNLTGPFWDQLFNRNPEGYADGGLVLDPFWEWYYGR